MPERATSKERSWLRKAASAVVERLGDRLGDHRVVLPSASELSAEATNTDGWWVGLAHLRDRKTEDVELWLDRFTNLGRPVACICYYSSDERAVRAIARAGIGRFGKALTIEGSRLNPNADEHYRMTPPLSAKEFGHPLLEHYPDIGVHYLGFFFSERIKTDVAPAAGFVAKLADTAQLLLQSASGALAQSSPEFPNVKNRSSVALHRRFDRHPAQSAAAKIRDGFTCQVCHINFVEIYGSLGRGYAEAHHLKPLSSLRKGAAITPDQLATVCANCHRMLHRLNGDPSDLKTLRRRLTGRWPKKKSPRRPSGSS